MRSVSSGKSSANAAAPASEPATACASGLGEAAAPIGKASDGERGERSAAERRRQSRESAAQLHTEA
eukprot:scaffold222323_cov41-Tisochrysis_lutea.AAC.1